MDHDLRRALNRFLNEATDAELRDRRESLLENLQRYRAADPAITFDIRRFLRLVEAELDGRLVRERLRQKRRLRRG
ncbi:MAG TPA: hypothetical protein PK177_04845 [Burkholderiaceae bacterium]|nr:hypothetical protein [Burkholderiaceae bacterium]